MREIKFEYGFESVNGTVKKVYHLSEIPFIKEKCDVWDMLPIKYVRQYTGLKDKNGKEIYEGDIVEAWSQGLKGRFEIRWRQEGSPCWILFPAWQSKQMWHISATHHTTGKQFISVSGEISATDREGYYDDGLTVIGNIYENPDLLTKL